MKAIRILLIAAGTLLLVRAFAGDATVSELLASLSGSRRGSIAALVVVLIGLWGLVRLLREEGKEQ